MTGCQADILRFLETNAADSDRSRMDYMVMQRMDKYAVPLRIAEIRWFEIPHDEVPRKSAGSAAESVLDGDTVRIPE